MGRFWICDPKGHRIEEQRKARENPTTELFGETVPVFHLALGLEPDEWICDTCNGTIRLEVNGREQWVACEGGSALCHECVAKVLKPDMSAQMVTWLMSGDARFWSSDVCGCAACKKYIAGAMVSSN